MNTLSNFKLKVNAQKLRKNMTKEERHLWYDFLKQLPYTVHRQKVFGNYIADFYIAAAQLVIELDGSQHFEKDGLSADQERDAFFRENGITVVRYANSDVNQHFDSVCQDILNRLQKMPSP
ncbi:MAG: endonuclease domain-containing protein [Clostridiales bacterium]|nr:endonuclease domain-containing protein [Clostridiales bacterium]